MRLDLSGTALVTTVALASTLAVGAIDAGLVGLILSYALTLTFYINFTARNFTDSETALASVERIERYAQARRRGRETLEGPRRRLVRA